MLPETCVDVFSMKESGNPTATTVGSEAGVLVAYGHKDSSWVCISIVCDPHTVRKTISAQQFKAICGENIEPFQGCQKLHC